MWKPPKPPYAAYKSSMFRQAATVCDFIFQIGEYEMLREQSEDVPVKEITS